MPNYGIELPSLEEEQALLAQQNEVAADGVNGSLVIEAIEAENPLISESERSCQNDLLEYCTGSSSSGSSFKSPNHTMCKYCVCILHFFVVYNLFLT